MNAYAGLAGLLLSACSTITVEGRLVDGLSGAPVPGPYRIRATAVAPDVALSCRFFDAEGGADGRFVLDRLCPGSAYRLEADRSDLWIVGTDEVPDGGWATPTDLVAWRVPEASGAYLASKGEIVTLRTDAEVRTETILNTQVEVRYPANVPSTVARVGPDEHLILVGRGAIDDLKFLPLVPSGSRRFGTGDAVSTMEPWVYVGVRFTDDTTFEEVEAELDTGKLVDHRKGERRVRYVPGTALPAGRYALMQDDDRRATLIDFGTPATP